MDPDQTPHDAASDLGLHCFSMSRKRDARLISVNVDLIGEAYLACASCIWYCIPKYKLQLVRETETLKVRCKNNVTKLCQILGCKVTWL